MISEHTQKQQERRLEMVKLTHQGYSMTMIAKQYNITRQAVSQLLRKATQEGHTVVKTRGNSNRPNYVVVKQIPIRTCQVCNQKFSSKHPRKTCGPNCLQKTIRIGGEWSRYENVTLTCNCCKKTFERSKYHHRINFVPEKNYYCSRDCYHKNKKPKDE